MEQFILVTYDYILIFAFRKEENKKTAKTDNARFLQRALVCLIRNLSYLFFLGSVIISHVYVFPGIIGADSRQKFAGVLCGAAGPPDGRYGRNF